MPTLFRKELTLSYLFTFHLRWVYLMTLRSTYGVRLFIRLMTVLSKPNPTKSCLKNIRESDNVSSRQCRQKSVSSVKLRGKLNQEPGDKVCPIFETRPLECFARCFETMNQRSTVQYAFKTNQRSSGNTVAFLIPVWLFYMHASLGCIQSITSICIWKGYVMLRKSHFCLLINKS